MRYEVSYNQVGLMQYNLNNPSNTIDLIDAILLRELNILAHADGMNTKVFNDNLYVWVSYKKLIDDFPTIGIETKDGMAKRLKHGLIKNRLIDFKIDKKDNSKTYFRLTTIGLQTDNYRMTDRTPIGLQTEPLSDGEQTNTSNSNKINIDKRGSALDFLKLNSFDQYERFEKENKKLIIDWEKFLLDFESKIVIESFPFETNKLFARLSLFARNWIKNDNRFKENIPNRPDLKRINEDENNRMANRHLHEAI